MLEKSLWEAGSREETLEGNRCKDQNGKTREIFLSAKYVWEKSLPIRPIEREEYAEFQVNKRPFCSDVWHL
jgi:hypothetical protein